VYRAKLKAGGPGKSAEEQQTWGGEVAVKVQRPAILETVTLDLLVIRNLVEAAANIPTNGNAALEQVVQNATGLIPVLDVAAERFLEELDYNLVRLNPKP
jgi:aarF domain-containing kinase